MKKLSYILIFLGFFSTACSDNVNKGTEKDLQAVRKKNHSSKRTIHRTISAKEDHLQQYQKMINSPDPKIRRDAIFSLGALGNNKEAQETLMEVMVNGSTAERVNAAGFLRTRQALPILVKALNDKNIGVRANAAQALGIIGDKTAIKSLKKLLIDKDKNVRIVAAKALFKLDDHTGIPIIEAALNDKDAMVRQQARRALNELDYYNRAKEGKDKDIEIIEALPEDEARKVLKKLKSK